MNRRTAVDAVLAFAASCPGQGLGYERMPQVQGVFASRRELLAALQDDWSRALWSRVEQLSMFASSASPAEVGRRAWAETTARHPVLRRVLDEHQRELSLHAHREQGRLVHSGVIRKSPAKGPAKARALAS